MRDVVLSTSSSLEIARALAARPARSEPPPLQFEPVASTGTAVTTTEPLLFTPGHTRAVLTGTQLACGPTTVFHTAPSVPAGTGGTPPAASLGPRGSTSVTTGTQIVCGPTNVFHTSPSAPAGIGGTPSAASLGSRGLSSDTSSDCSGSSSEDEPAPESQALTRHTRRSTPVLLRVCPDLHASMVKNARRHILRFFNYRPEGAFGRLCDPSRQSEVSYSGPDSRCVSQTAGRRSGTRRMLWHAPISLLPSTVLLVL